jgi:glycogen synthase
LREFVGRHAPDFLQFAARIITVSRAVAEDLQRSDIDPRKIIPIHDGQDLTFFNPEKFDRKSLRAAAGISPETKVIYMITRINPEKRLETLIQALPAVIQKFPDVLALFVGEASASNVSYFKAMQEHVGALKLNKHVRFWGFEKNVASIHAFSDILVNARPDEPFGHSILEALAMGVPVVAPDRGGHTEILKHYENAVLFDAENPQALGAELIRLLADPKTAKKLADQGRLLVQTVSIPAHVARVTRVYDDVLNRAQASWALQPL